MWRQYFAKLMNISVLILLNGEVLANTNWFRDSPILSFNQGITDDT